MGKASDDRHIFESKIWYSSDPRRGKFLHLIGGGYNTATQLMIARDDWSLSMMEVGWHLDRHQVGSPIYSNSRMILYYEASPQFK